MRLAVGLGAIVLALAACSAPEKLILPGKVDLALAPGDTMRLCTDDGVEDTTPASDCVIMDQRARPIAAYGDALKSKGWERVESGADDMREVWTRAGATACSRLVIDAAHEKMSRKRSLILRFDVSEGPCTA